MEVTARPLDTLNSAKNKRIIVYLNNKQEIAGILKAFDISINCVLDKAGFLDNESGRTKRQVGTIFIKGDSIISIITGD